MGKVSCLAGAVVLGLMLSIRAEEGEGLRTPAFTLKTLRQLLSDEEIALARKQIAEYPAAKRIADNVCKAADVWLEWPDEGLRDLIPSAKVPRAFNVCTAGCPKCGKKIYEKGGTYPWVIDPKKPFKVKCPVCGDVFPDNDFEAYYHGGFKDDQYLQGEYVDDGWGWEGPDDHYWFVAYANHWTWHSHIRPAVLNLARAYVLTGDWRYAHKAVVMLDRIAEVYPGMDYHNQSRYGQLEGERGGHYGGKIVNLIWETGMLTNLAESYDSVWETIDGDTEAQELTGKTGEQIRANIEANILEEGIDAVFAQEIRGNFGMHQRALAYAVAARQFGKVDEWLDRIVAYPGASRAHIGLNYALYNLVYRDGLPYETSPGYNWSWVANITTVAETLKRAGRDVYAIPKTKRLYEGVLDMHNIRKFTPSLGDSGNVYGGKVGCDGRVFQAAYRAYGGERFLNHLAAFGATGEACFGSYESLFKPPIEAASGEFPAQACRLLDGYGMAILNNPADTISAALYYGYRGGHGHFDRLHFDLFAQDHPMMPDLGYPDFMNSYVSGIYTWSKNTINHNTVTVDARRQPGNVAGTVQLFADGAFARVVDVEAPGTYPQCPRYRRCLLMVDVDAERSYYVDVFTVEGGRQHDYSLHGPPGTFEAVGGTWRAQEKGTLAGEDVEVGEIYDNLELGAPDYKGVYHSYMGSGFQHLFDVRRHQGGAWVAHWAHERDAEAKLRVRVLDQPDQEVILAKAQVSPVKHKQLIDYVIARRQAEEGLTSRFVSVIEPFTGEPFVKNARRLALDAGEGVAVGVELPDGVTDIVVYGPSGVEKTVGEYGLRTDAALAVARVTKDGAVLKAFLADGRFVSVGDVEVKAPPPVAGEVIGLAPARFEVRVRLDSVPEGFEAASLEGRVAHFVNDLRRTAHPIAVARLEGDELVLVTRDDLLVGRAHVTGIGDDALQTDTAFAFASVYAGAWVAAAEFGQYMPVHDVAEGRIRLAARLPQEHAFKVGEDAWIVNVGPGDRLEVPAVTSYQ